MDFKWLALLSFVVHLWPKLNVICQSSSYFSLVQLPKTAIAVSDDIAVFSNTVPMIWSYPIAENGDIVENSDNT